MALNTRGSRKSCIEKRRALSLAIIHRDVGDGGQQISNSSASMASSSGTDRGGSRGARTNEHGGLERRRRQSKSKVVCVGLGTD